MTEEKIKLAIENCFSKREFFVSEMDFQFAFANELRSSIGKSKKYEIYLGYRPQKNFKKAMHIDIVLMNENYFIPIELKYKTKEATVDTKLEEYTFKYQKAYPDNCKKYLDDIKRIENLRDYNGFKEGYAIFLTNDEKYLEILKKDTVGKKNVVEMNKMTNRKFIPVENIKDNKNHYYYLINRVTKKGE